MTKKPFSGISGERLCVEVHISISKQSVDFLSGQFVVGHIDLFFLSVLGFFQRVHERFRRLWGVNAQHVENAVGRHMRPSFRHAEHNIDRDFCQLPLLFTFATR